jgi:CheY-like chemotaxis protein
MAYILLVEDDALISKMITLRLQLRGHQVDTAVNGQEGVEKAWSGTYDMVLMDMHMPVLDGHEAATRLRSLGYNKRIVAVTASVMSEDSQKAIESGCDAYISKPIGPDFEERIDELLAP